MQEHSLTDYPNSDGIDTPTQGRATIYSSSSSSNLKRQQQQQQQQQQQAQQQQQQCGIVFQNASPSISGRFG